MEGGGGNGGVYDAHQEALSSTHPPPPSSPCKHEHSLVCGIDVVCTGCGLVLDVRPFDTYHQQPQWDPNGLPDRDVQTHCCSRRFATEIDRVCSRLGMIASSSLTRSLSAGSRRPEGKLEYAALARVYSHFRLELPIEFVLETLGVSLHAAAPALIAEGVYDNEPLETLVDFAMRRSEAPREAREECLRALRDFPSLSRRLVVSVIIAEWVGNDVAARSLAIDLGSVKRASAVLDKLRLER